MNNINQEIEDLEATLVSLKAKAKAQEPTLTPVSFKSKGELAKALIEGRTFKTTYSGVTLMYIDSWGWGSPFRLMRDGKDCGYVNGAWSHYADLQEINAAEPWYLNIPPEGVECYVSDDSPNPYLGLNTTGLITEYDQSFLMPFRSNNLRWKYATPINEGK